MNYPEFLRARTVVYWFTGTIALIVLINLIASTSAAVFSGHVVIDGDTPGAFPASAVLSILGFIVAILATILGTSLNRYREYGETVMTFPASRRAFAARVLATDIAALAVAFIIAMVLTAILLMINHAWKYVVFDSEFALRFVICLGAVVLWLAVCEAASAWLNHRATYVAGLSWPVFIAIASFEGGSAHMPAWIRPIIDFASYLNPLTYLAVSVSASGHSHYQFENNLVLQALTVWSISLIALAVAVAGWQRQEL